MHKFSDAVRLASLAQGDPQEEAALTPAIAAANAVASFADRARQVANDAQTCQKPECARGLLEGLRARLEETILGQKTALPSPPPEVRWKQFWERVCPPEQLSNVTVVKLDWVTCHVWHWSFKVDVPLGDNMTLTLTPLWWIRGKPWFDACLSIPMANDTVLHLALSLVWGGNFTEDYEVSIGLTIPRKHFAMTMTEEEVLPQERAASAGTRQITVGASFGGRFRTTFLPPAEWVGKWRDIPYIEWFPIKTGFSSDGSVGLASEARVGLNWGGKKLKETLQKIVPGGTKKNAMILRLTPAQWILVCPKWDWKKGVADKCDMWLLWWVV
jgi:hypothetical protein